MGEDRGMNQLAPLPSPALALPALIAAADDTARLRNAPRNIAREIQAQSLAGDTVATARLMRNHILGGAGVPEHWFGGGGDVVAVDEDFARRGPVEAVEMGDERRFAAAGGADDAEKFPALDAEADVVKRRCGVGHALAVPGPQPLDDMAGGNGTRQGLRCAQSSVPALARKHHLENILVVLLLFL